MVCFEEYIILGASCFIALLVFAITVILYQVWIEELRAAALKAEQREIIIWYPA